MMKRDKVWILTLDDSAEYIFDNSFFSGTLKDASKEFLIKYKKYLKTWGYCIDYLTNLKCHRDSWHGCGYVERSNRAAMNGSEIYITKINKCKNKELFKRIERRARADVGDNNIMGNGFITIDNQRTLNISPWMRTGEQCPVCSSVPRIVSMLPQRIYRIGNTNIELYRGDITRITADAIVNAANPSLMGYGGVDGSIHELGGFALDKECRELQRKGGCPVGEARITTGGDLPSKYVIHTVGPRWGVESDPIGKLKMCYLNSLSIARSYGLKSIIFSSISTGIYGFPKDKAANIAKEVVIENITEFNELSVIGWCLFDVNTFNVYADAWED